MRERWASLRDSLSSDRGRVPLMAALTVLLALVSFGAWAWASPPGASADEDFHVASIWCALGERDGACAPGNRPETRHVPAELLQLTCFAFQPDVSASCQNGIERPSELVETERGNFHGLYPPGFYAVMSLFVGEDVGRSVVVMRSVSGAVVVLLVGLTAAAASSSAVRTATLLGASLVAVPAGFYFGASLNPSGWAIASVPLVASGLFSYLHSEGRRRWFAAVATLVSLAAAISARGDAAMYSVLAACTIVLLTFRRGPGMLRRLALPALVVVVGTVAFLATGQSSVASQGFTDGTPGRPATPARFVSLLLSVPTLWVGALGHEGLGWLDTYMPSIVWVTTTVLFAGVVFQSIRRAGWRQLLAVGGLVGILWTLPAYLLLLSGAVVGEQVQSRYLVPLMGLLGVVALLPATAAPVHPSRQQRWLIVVGLAGAHAVALHTTMRRFVTGLDEQYVDLGHEAEWWWSSGPTPMAVWIVGTIAFAALVAALAWWQARADSTGPAYQAGLPAESNAAGR